MKLTKKRVQEIKNDTAALGITYHRYGMVHSELRRRFNASRLHMYQSNLKPTSRLAHARWWSRFVELVEWHSLHSRFENGKDRGALKDCKHTTPTFPTFIKSARYVHNFDGVDTDPIPAVLFDFGNATLYIDVGQASGYSVDAWGQWLESSDLYTAAMYLYAEALDETCPEFIAYRLARANPV